MSSIPVSKLQGFRRTVDFNNLSVDELVEFRKFNVTPEFYYEIGAEGFAQATHSGIWV